MSQFSFGKSELVIYSSGIYVITEVIANEVEPSYKISLVSYLEMSAGGIDENIPREAQVRESALQKFEYGLPRYALGSRLADGSEVYLVIFKHDSHQYRYNLSNQNNIRVNLTQDDLVWSS